jgi:hypothetical protein
MFRHLTVSREEKILGGDDILAEVFFGVNILAIVRNEGTMNIVFDIVILLLGLQEV